MEAAAVFLMTGFGQDCITYFFPPKKQIVMWEVIPPDKF
jgi:hypothetical protein